MKRPYLFVVIMMVLVPIMAACSGPLFTQRQKPLNNIDEAKLASGQGAVLMHAINRQSLIATRWFKIDEPQTRLTLTTFSSSRHRSRDSLNSYDVVMLDPGTYVLYSISSNCAEGLRSSLSNWDEPLRTSVANELGMVYEVQQWSAADAATGISVWGGNRRGGVGVNTSLGGVFSGAPGLPVATCALIGQGLNDSGQVTMASITVNAGEIVYAGELDIEFAPTATCDRSGNWMTQNETRSYCGAEFLRLSVRDASYSAIPFIEKQVPLAAHKTVTRLASPGVLIGR
ncbi:MAG: hypothetical protein ACRCTY_03870 [Candidatus Adiutrix sp.]